MIGPTSLGLLLDAVGVSLLSLSVYSTTSKLRNAVEQSIVEAESALLVAASSSRRPRRAARAASPESELEASLLKLRRERANVRRHLWLIVVGAAFVICGLSSQLSGSWPN